MSVQVTLNYQLSTENAFAHSINLNAGYFGSAGYQAKVEADQTDHSGPGNGTDAYVYDDLNGSGETIGYSRTTHFSGTYDTTLTATVSTDISQQIEAAAGAGRDLVLTLTEQDSSEDELVLDNTYIEVDATRGPNPLTIAGTRSDQPVAADGSVLPFATVSLGDSANPSGAGDDVSIIILDPNGDETGAYGTLAGAGLTSYGNGQYELGPLSSLSALQTELDGLVFTASTGAAGAHAVFELDLQSATGSAADDQTTSVDITPPCFAQGTSIATPSGRVAVEHLRAGDLVLLATGGEAVVRWVGHRRAEPRTASRPGTVQPIRIGTGAFGAGLPERALRLSPDHAVYADGALIPVHLLVDGAGIVQEEVDQVIYHHVELERHGILLAEGLPAESYLDTGNRSKFANCPLILPTAGPAVPCAPVVLAGPILEAVRERVRSNWQDPRRRAA